MDEVTEKPQKLCFVIGPIGEAGTPIRKHADFLLKGIIRPAVSELGYRVKRADEDTIPGMISDRIIHDILEADLVVADLTDLNPNAFYELGIRHSRGKPTIHIARQGTRLPFDNFGHDCIFVDITDVDDLEAAKKRLTSNVTTTEHEDFVVTNPITHANASFKMKQSADPQDMMMSEIMNRLIRLERRDMMTVDDKSETDTMGEIVSTLSAMNYSDFDIGRIAAAALTYWINSNRTASVGDAIKVALVEPQGKVGWWPNPLAKDPSKGSIL